MAIEHVVFVGALPANFGVKVQAAGGESPGFEDLIHHQGIFFHAVRELIGIPANQLVSLIRVNRAKDAVDPRGIQLMLEGVLGHELGHIRNYDIRVSLAVFGLAVAVGLVADLLMRFAFFGGARRGGNNQTQVLFLIFGLVAAIVAPLLAGVVQASISRQREYLADATSALTTRDPDGLASALAKLGEYGRPLAKANTSMAHLWISDPLRPGAVSRLFATHPPIPDRIARLQHMGDRF